MEHEFDTETFRDNLERLNKIIDYGNKKGWNPTEPIERWQERYDLEVK